MEARYDESEIRVRLTRLDHASRVAFAAACAERLWPLFERYVQATGLGDVALLRSALDEVWLVAEGRENGADLSRVEKVALSMVPADDGEWVFEMGYGQNAAAAVAYALQGSLTDDPQDGVWASRQVYEAADYAARCLRPDLDLSSADAEQELSRSDTVQVAVSGVIADLESLEGEAGLSGLQDRARREGAVWARSLP